MLLPPIDLICEAWRLGSFVLNTAVISGQSFPVAQLTLEFMLDRQFLSFCFGLNTVVILLVPPFHSEPVQLEGLY